MSDKVKFAICGALAGVVNGFFGGGGGMIFIPLSTGWAGLEPKKAFATCVGVILPITALSALVYLWRGGLSLSLAAPYIIGGTVGGLIAGRALVKLPVKLLRRVLALFIIYGGWRSLMC